MVHIVSPLKIHMKKKTDDLLKVQSNLKIVLKKKKEEERRKEGRK